jgi:hypothetical protein
MCSNRPNGPIIVHKFEFLNKIKNQEKYVKKLDKIIRLLMKKFFKISIVCLVKIQILSNIKKWAHMTHEL